MEEIYLQEMTNKLYILCGIPFSGKTTFAKAIVKRYGFQRVDLDEVKFKLYGKDIKDEDLQQEDWDKIYQQMYSEIKEYLEDGQTVIHDAGNFTKYERDLIKKIADKLNIESITIFVDIPIEVARERLIRNRNSHKRFDISDKSFNAAVAEMEKPTSEENNLIFQENDNAEEWITEKLVQKQVVSY